MRRLKFSLNFFEQNIFFFKYHYVRCRDLNISAYLHKWVRQKFKGNKLYNLGTLSSLGQNLS